MSEDCVCNGTLQAYLDGELGLTAQVVDAHLKGCEHCSAALRRLQVTAARVDGLFDSLADEAPHPATLPLPRLRHAGRAAAVIGLAACLAVVGSLFMMRNKSVFPVTNAPSKFPIDTSNTFVPEPGFDPAVPTGKLMIIQVEVPVSALSHDGSATDSANSRVLAEILMDEDGTTYGVRLANSKGE